MSSDLLGTGLAALAFSRRNLLGFLEDIPDDKWCHQPVPGMNHAMWVMGHLASTDNCVLTMIGGQASGVTEEWNAMFGQGSTPVADPAAYPSPAEVQEKLTGRREDLLAWFQSLSAEELASPLPSDYAGFGPSYAAMMSSLAWHEGLPAGQLTMIRRSLGIGPKFG